MRIIFLFVHYWGPNSKNFSQRIQVNSRFKKNKNKIQTNSKYFKLTQDISKYLQIFQDMLMNFLWILQQLHYG
jgi:hypothetical protein